MDTIQTILRFDAVSCVIDNDSVATFRDAGFSLEAGRIAAVHIDADSEQVPIADLATGLLAPASGRVFFKERDWAAMGPFEQAAARGRIGCVLEQKNWISSLTVLQNVMLRERHHTLRPESDIAEEALRLCRRIGLDDVPVVRPDRVRQRELRMLEWVRAFMGRPDLVVLAFPEREALAGGSECCMRLVESAISEGTAVMWISDRSDVWCQPLMQAADHYEIKAERWLPLERERR